MTGCVFCPVQEPAYRVGGLERKQTLRWPQIRDVLRIREDSHGIRHAVAVPLNPVTPGHMLVIPEFHVANASVRPRITGGAMEVAAEHASLAFDHYNLITSVGAPATQSVPHLHVHIVPRSTGDGLHLPWTGQHT